MLATNPTTTGEATALHIAERAAGPRSTVTRLASGLPVGADLEHADEVTLGKALAGRQSASASYIGGRVVVAAAALRDLVPVASSRPCRTSS